MRIGKHERTRVKKPRRDTMTTWLPTGNVAGAGTFRVHAGKNKFHKAVIAFWRLRDSSGDSVTLKLSGSAKRPVYTVEPRHII